MRNIARFYSRWTTRRRNPSQWSFGTDLKGFKCRMFMECIRQGEGRKRMNFRKKRYNLGVDSRLVGIFDIFMLKENVIKFKTDPFLNLSQIFSPTHSNLYIFCDFSPYFLFSILQYFLQLFPVFYFCFHLPYVFNIQYGINLIFNTFVFSFSILFLIFLFLLTFLRRRRYAKR